MELASAEGISLTADHVSPAFATGRRWEKGDAEVWSSLLQLYDAIRGGPSKGKPLRRTKFRRSLIAQHRFSSPKREGIDRI